MYKRFTNLLGARVEIIKANQPNHADLKSPVRLGLVGCGRVAEFGYLPALRRATGVELIGVADINLARCTAIALGVLAYDNIRALIAAGGLDALVISTPTRFHLADARCAAEARLPALVEKPPGANVREACALHALKPSPWLAFNRRFEPGITKFKDGLPGDGKLHLQLELHYRRNSWRPFDMQDDALLDLGPHLIDLARWLTQSDIIWVRAHAVHERRAEFELELERGHASVSCSNNSPYRERIAAKDSLGRVHVSYKRGGLLSGAVARLRPKQENPLVTSLVGQLEAFGRAVGGSLAGSPLATVADGLAVMCAIDAVRRSAVRGSAPIAVHVVRQAD
jgi:myo-inositol 2-dehydrogenase / D-chiro-inositol 1-dehydrogenase